MHKDRIKQKQSKTAYRDAVAGIINIAYITVYTKGYDKGIFWTDRMSNLLKEYQKLFPKDEEYIDKQWARYYIFRATALEGLGHHHKAEKAYQAYLNKKFSNTTEGLTNASDFLTVAKRWDEAVASYRTIMAYLKE
jgi:hypothetical protein